jgi:hypothetical protein
MSIVDSNPRGQWASSEEQRLLQHIKERLAELAAHSFN